MSRANYDEDAYGWELIMWRGAVASAINGKRGQSFLRELIAALDALPEKRLTSHELRVRPPELDAGTVCALGSVGQMRGMDLETLDPENYNVLAREFGIAPAMIREIEYMNDEAGWNDTDETRWQRMREWAVSNLKKESIK